MSEFSRVLEGVGLVNNGLNELRQRGGKLMANLEGRPDLRIDSLNPLVFEQYGRIFNRGPMIAGRLAICGLAASERYDESVGLYLVAQVPQLPTMYGFALQEAEQANRLALAVGRPDVYFEER
jgi:hypothetical protein